MILYRTALSKQRDLTSLAGFEQRLQSKQQAYPSLLDAKSASTLVQSIEINKGWNSFGLITCAKHTIYNSLLKCNRSNLKCWMSSALGSVKFTSCSTSMKTWSKSKISTGAIHSQNKALTFWLTKIKPRQQNRSKSIPKWQSKERSNNFC